VEHPRPAWRGRRSPAQARSYKSRNACGRAAGGLWPSSPRGCGPNVPLCAACARRGPLPSSVLAIASSPAYDIPCTRSSGRHGCADSAESPQAASYRSSVGMSSRFSQYFPRRVSRGVQFWQHRLHLPRLARYRPASVEAARWKQSVVDKDQRSDDRSDHNHPEEDTDAQPENASTGSVPSGRRSALIDELVLEGVGHLLPIDPPPPFRKRSGSFATF
jgi:hypothetical protein